MTLRCDYTQNTTTKKAGGCDIFLIPLFFGRRSSRNNEEGNGVFFIVCSLVFARNNAEYGKRRKRKYYFSIFFCFFYYRLVYLVRIVWLIPTVCQRYTNILLFFSGEALLETFLLLLIYLLGTDVVRWGKYIFFPLQLEMTDIILGWSIFPFPFLLFSSRPSLRPCILYILCIYELLW